MFFVFSAQMVKLPVARRSDGPVHTGGGKMLRNDLLVKESVYVWRGFCLVLPACLVVPPVFVHCFRSFGGFLGQMPFFTSKSTTPFISCFGLPGLIISLPPQRPSTHSAGAH